MYTIIDGGCFKNMLIGAYQMFEQKYEILNQLNVFPVPDGDTGNNMLNTLKSMYSMISDVSADEPVGMIAEKASAGAIMGARGNSGVILSQIIHGISRGLRGKKTASGTQMGKAFQYGILYAYRAVTKPVEGTILSVARGIAKGTYEVIRQEPDFSKVLESAIGHGNDALAKTPEQLKILKDANVVDAGGQGLIFFLIGCLNGLTGKVSEVNLEIKPVISRLEAKGESFSIEYPYCTEFIISPCKLAAKEIRQKLGTWGESMIVAEGDNLIKVHIHAQRPGHVLDMAASWGTLHDIKCDNMVDQFHKNKEKQQDEPKRPLGVLAVVSGDGWTELYQKLGCDVVSGGQSMNPSVQELNAGIENGRYDKYILLPNNKNIIASAKLAAKRDNRDIIVIDTKTMLEGYYFTKNRKMNLQTLLRQLKFNNSIEITKAVRDTKVNDIEIKIGDNIALVNGTLTEKAERVEDLIKKIYERYTNDNTLAITIVRGKTATEEGNEAIKSKNFKKFYEYDGEQDNYSYYIYLEQRDPSLSKIAILTDSASDITPDMIEGLDVTVIPIRLKIGENNYKDGVNLSKKEFWHKLLTENVVPKTAQPSPAEFRDYYEELFNKGYEKILSIHISSKMSGTQQVAKVAREMLKREKDIIIVDSKSVTFGQAYQVLEAAKMIKAGAKLEDILTRLYEIADKMKVYFAVSDLTYLEKGGRIGRASSVIGNLLKLRPVLKLEDGEVSLETKTFGERGAISYMEKIIKNEGKNSIYLYTAWGGTNQELQSTDILKKTADTMRKVEFKGRFEIGATIGSHSGPVFGIGIISKIR